MCKRFTLLQELGNTPAFADQLCCFRWLALAEFGVLHAVFCLDPKLGLQTGSMLHCISNIACNLTHAIVFA